MAAKNSRLILDPDLPGPVEQSVADIDARGRVRIPSHLVAAIDWLRNQKGATDSLAVYDEPGRIVLLSWEEASVAVLAKRKELIEKSGESPEAINGLRILEDRYKRLILPKELRPTLSTEALMHLDLPIGTETHVYILRVSESLEILSPRYRNQQRLTNLDILADLP